MMTAPMLAATRYQYPRACDGTWVSPWTSAAGSTGARSATHTNTNSNSPSAIATRSTRRYDPVHTTASRNAAASDRLHARGTPNSSPTPATPENSVTIAPIDATAKPATDTQ